MTDKEFIEKLQLNTLEHNKVAAVAFMNGRDYITPEDVTEAFERGYDVDKVRLDVLEIFGDNAGFGVEDRGLTAFVAFEGK